MKAQLILCQMASDPRVPANAMGYIADLQNSPSESIEADRLMMLNKYVPDLVQQYNQARKER